MKPLRLVLAIAAILVCISLTNAFSAGYGNPSEQDCSCDSLVRQGIKPDAINRLTSAFSFLNVSPYLDRLAVEVKAILSQFGLGEKIRSDREAALYNKSLKQNMGGKTVSKVKRGKKI
jgi:hypothetical protein